MKTEVKIILIAVLLALLSWVAEAVSDYYTFFGGRGSFWQLLTGASSAEILVRAGILLVFVGLGLVAATALGRRKRAEESLRSSEEKYRELVQNANSIIIRWNRDGVLTFFNEFAQSFFGYSEDEVIGKNVIGTIVPETDTAGRDMTGLMIDICNRPQTHETNVNENMLKDGRRVWIAWTNKPVFDESQNLTEVLSVGIDITQQRHVAEALQESQQMLQLVLDTVPARVFWKNRNLEYMGCSHLFAVDAGLASPADIVGKTDLDMPWKDTEAERYREDDRIAMETGIPRIGYEEARYTAEGRTIWVVTSKVLLRNANGRTIGVLGTYEDITERKRAEEERRALEQQMEEHNRRFYRETILSVTDGKLDICGPEEVGAYLADARLVTRVDDASAIGKARHAVEDYCRDVGLPDEQNDLLVLGVGEAITNAIKHAVQACVYTGTKEGSVWVAVSDKGKGIDSLILPRAVFLRGFSTKPSLGLGYCVMLDVADHVLLNTGEQGTTVVLVESLCRTEPMPSLDHIPDTWAAVAS